MPSLGNLFVTLGVDSKPLEQGSKKAESTLGRLNSKLGTVAKAGAALGVALGAAGTAMVAGLYTKGAKLIDQQAKVARSLGGTTRAVQALGVAFNDAGVGAEAGAREIQTLNQRLGEAARLGSGPAYEALQRLGVSAQQLANMDADERIALLADRFQQLGYSSQQTADALRDLGVRNKLMVQMMMDGGDQVRNAAKEISALGIAVSDVDAAQIEAANDAFGRIAMIVQGIANQIAKNLSPYVKTLAEQFSNVAKETGGFSDVIAETIPKVLRGFGMMGNVLQGLRVVFKGLQVVAAGFAGAAMSAIELAARGIAGFLDGINGGVNATIGQLNKLPGVSIGLIDSFSESPFMQGIKDAGNDARNLVGTLRSELHELAMQEMPADKIEAFLRKVQEEAKKTAAATVAARQGLGGDDATEEGGESDADKAHKDQLNARLERLRQTYMTERGLSAERMQAELDELNLLRESKLIADTDWNTLEEEIKQGHADRMTAIDQQAADEQLKIEQTKQAAMKAAQATFFQNMSGLMNTSNKKAFEVGKKAAVAQAAISGARGVMEAWRSGMETSGPWAPVVAAGYAAAAAINSANMINNIKKQQFGGGGGAPTPPGQGSSGVGSSGAAGGGAGGAGGEGAGGPVTVTMRGLDPSQLYSGRQLGTLFEALQAEAGDRGLRFAGF